jgi:hypothetical protein
LVKDLAHEILHQERVTIPFLYAESKDDLNHGKSTSELLYETQEGGCLMFISYVQTLHANPDPPAGGL